jgi:hypothetical protein
VSDAPKSADDVRRLAEQAGLQRALALAPEIVAATAKRGLHPLSKPPAGLTATTSPAAIFDPAAFESKR